MGFSVPDDKDTLRNKVYGEIAGLQKWQRREVIQKKQNTSIKQYSRHQHTFTTCLNSAFFTAVVYTLNKKHFLVIVLIKTEINRKCDINYGNCVMPLSNYSEWPVNYSRHVFLTWTLWTHRLFPTSVRLRKIREAKIRSLFVVCQQRYMPGASSDKSLKSVNYKCSNCFGVQIQ